VLRRLTDIVVRFSVLRWMANSYTAPYANGSTILRFGADRMAVQNVSSAEIDGPCYGKGQYDPYP